MSRAHHPSTTELSIRDPYSANEIADSLTKGYAVRIDQAIAIVLKPKPKFISQKLWVKLASLFIHIEKTEPTMQIKEQS